MNHASRRALVTLATRTTLTTLILLASAAPLAASLTGLWPGSPPLLAFAVGALALVGMLFHELLARRLGAADQARKLQQCCLDAQTARASAERSLADVHAALCGLVRQQEQVRDNERQRIARDIHDDLGQHLLALKIEVQLARNGTAAAAEPLSRLSTSIDGSIAALRTVIDNLRPIELQDGLAVAVAHHLRECARLNSIDCRLQPGSDQALRGIDGDSEVMLLRIVREAVANVLRHACAGRIELAARRSEGMLTLEIADNGIGMGMSAADPAVPGQPAHGCGLAGIAERVAAVGGRFAIASGEQRGTVLTITVPISCR